MTLPDRCFARLPNVASLALCDNAGAFTDADVTAAVDMLHRAMTEGTVDLSDADRDAAIAKVRDAWKALHPDTSESEMPEVLRAAEPRATADETVVDKPSRDYLTALWNKIKEIAGDKLSKEDFEAAHRSAMGSAGGKATARKKKQTAEQVRAHAVVHPQPVASCEYCYGSHEPDEKLPKNDPRVLYRDAATVDPDTGLAEIGMDTLACGRCRFYQWGSCHLVEGSIEADDVCDLYLPPVQTYLAMPGTSLYSAADGHGGAWRLFNELAQAFADAPEWVNILPKPGSYSHPSYGTILIDAGRNERFVKNFDDQVYQQKLPITIDIEHDGKMSGAVGWFEELRVNDDGSVDARVRWNDRGKTLIEQDAFKYFSPEWWEEWTDPVSRTVYQDVLIGGAICVRPFFKEGALRPLVASEHRLVAVGEISPDRTTIWMQPVAAVQQQKEAPRVSKIELTEDEVQAFREAQAKVATLEAQAAAETEARQAAEARVAVLEAENRTKRFTDMVMGRGEAGDGAVWVGAIQDNVASLHRLATAFGEDSDEFKAEVALRREAAKVAKESGLFKPLGSSESGDGEGPAGEVQKLAEAKLAADASLTIEQARVQVYRERPELREQVEQGR